jgi:hypothetical protein
MSSTRRALKLLVATAAFLLAGQAAISAADASRTVTVAPSAPSTGNCFPFGASYWTPYFGFVYKNLPPFQLKAGDTLAFDTGEPSSDADAEMQIDLASTTANGDDTPALPYTAVVRNTQTPANPRGDSTAGNFELRYTLEAPFSFPGGGLIILFSNPSATYAMNGTNCEGALVHADGSDPSGYFLERFYNESDGVPPYDNPDPASIGGFQLTIADPPVPPSHKMCKKKKHKRAAQSSKKKKCKKKKRSRTA